MVRGSEHARWESSVQDMILQYAVNSVGVHDSGLSGLGGEEFVEGCVVGRYECDACCTGEGLEEYGLGGEEAYGLLKMSRGLRREGRYCGVC